MRSQSRSVAAAVRICIQVSDGYPSPIAPQGPATEHIVETARLFPNAEHLAEVVGVFSKDRTGRRDYRPFSYPGFSDVRDAGGPFAHLAGHTVALAGVTENDITRPVTADIVTTGFFETLGVQPVYARHLAAAPLFLRDRGRAIDARDLTSVLLVGHRFQPLDVFPSTIS